MTKTPQGMSEEELRKGLSKIRDKIIESANDGYSESINDEDYYDKPLFDLITQYSLTKQLEARVDEQYRTDGAFKRFQVQESAEGDYVSAENDWISGEERIRQLQHQLQKNKEDK